MSKNGEIYTTDKNFTLPPGLTGWTNSTSVLMLMLMLVVMVTMMQIRTVVTLVLASHAKTPQEQGGFLGDESPLSVWVETFK